MANLKQSLLIALVINASICLVYGHVAFTFPPARKYDLDFLDNSRTPGPCGMPKGELIYLKIYISLLRKHNET